MSQRVARRPHLSASHVMKRMTGRLPRSGSASHAACSTRPFSVPFSSLPIIAGLERTRRDESVPAHDAKSAAAGPGLREMYRERFRGPQRRMELDEPSPP